VDCHANEEGLEDIWSVYTWGRETIYREQLTEAAKPCEDRRERDEEGIVSVKPPSSPQYHRVSQVQLRNNVNEYVLQVPKEEQLTYSSGE
jgi:hypothetical protein